MTVDYAHVFPGFLTPVQTQISFQRHRLLFSHASAEVRGENTPERKFTHNHQESGVQHTHHCRLNHQGGVQLKETQYF